MLVSVFPALHLEVRLESERSGGAEGQPHRGVYIMTVHAGRIGVVSKIGVQSLHIPLLTAPPDNPRPPRGPCGTLSKSKAHF